MTILVTGASGHLGRFVVDSMLRRGVPAKDIVATSRNADGLKELADLDVHVRVADFDDPAGLPAAFAGADRVLLVSAPELGQRARQHANAIDAAKAAGVDFIAYTSIAHADTSSLLLAVEHLATERHLVASGISHTLLRNSWYLENYTDQMETYLAHGMAGAAGIGRVSAATRRDFAEAAAAVLTQDGHSGATYELGGQALTLPDIAAAITRATGTSVTYTDLSAEAYEQVLLGAGLPPAIAHMVADSDRGLAHGDLYVETIDLETLLGRPATTIAEALRT